MADRIFMTEQGYKAAVQRLNLLKLEKRKEITERIKTAREFGDLSENAEYDAAKNEQAMLEGEILELENRIKLAEIIKEDANKETVSLGCKVEVYDEEFDENIEYEVVGTAEADPKKNRISNESPFGKGLIGKRVGELAVISAPQGDIKLKILNIR
jgi:transcription elongation factor GreA